MRKARRLFVPPMPANLFELAQLLEQWEPVKDFYRGYVTAEDGSISLMFITNKMLSVMTSRRKNISMALADGTFSVS